MNRSPVDGFEPIGDSPRPLECMDRIEIALRDLRRSLNRIKELSAWLELLKAEKRGRRDSFSCMYDPTEGDLKAEMRYCQILCFEFLIQAASFFTPSTNRTPSMTSRMISDPFNTRQRLAAL